MRGAGAIATGCNRRSLQPGLLRHVDAAHAALIATGHELPTTPIKTHHMLIAAFGMQLVKTGRVDPGLGRDLNQVQDMRLLADYSAEPPVLDDATWAVQQAEAFVIAMRMLVTDVPPV